MTEFRRRWSIIPEENKKTLLGTVREESRREAAIRQMSEQDSAVLSTQLTICVIASLADEALQDKTTDNADGCLNSISTALQTAEMMLSVESKKHDDSQKTGALSLRSQILNDLSTSEIHRHTIETLDVLSTLLQEDKSGRYHVALRMTQELGELLAGLTNENGIQRDIHKDSVERLIADAMFGLPGIRLPIVSGDGLHAGLAQKNPQWSYYAHDGHIYDGPASPDGQYAAGHHTGLGFFHNPAKGYVEQSSDFKVRSGPKDWERLTRIPCEIAVKYRENYSFSPDSRFLAFTFVNTLYIVDCSTRKPKVFAQDDVAGGLIKGVSWTRDGTFLKLDIDDKREVWLQFDVRTVAFSGKAAESASTNYCSELATTDRASSGHYNSWRERRDGGSFYQYLLDTHNRETQIFSAGEMLGIVKSLLDAAKQEYMDDVSVANLPDEEIQNQAVETFVGITTTVSGILYEYFKTRMELGDGDFSREIQATGREIDNSPESSGMLQSTWNTLNQILDLDGIARCAAYTPAKIALIELRETLINIAPRLKHEAEAAIDPLRNFTLRDGVDPKQLKKDIMNRAFEGASEEQRGPLLDTFKSFGWTVPTILELKKQLRW